MAYVGSRLNCELDVTWSQRYQRALLEWDSGPAAGVEFSTRFGWLDSPMLARVTGATGAKQLTLPDEVFASFPGVDCFDVSEEGGRIVLTPVRTSRLDAVHQKLAELGITEEDVRDAVAWARRR